MVSKEKSPKDMQMDYLDKIKPRLNLISDGSFIVDDEESVRIEKL